LGLSIWWRCYLFINGKEGHSIHASYFGDAEKDMHHGAIVRGFRDIDGELPARVRATRMVLALPEAKTIRYTPQATFDNIHGDTIATEHALEATARVHMDSEYATGGNRMEAIVTSLLIAKWQRVHDNMIGDIAWIAIYRADHEEFGECRPDMRRIAPCQRNALLEETYRQLVLYLEIPGITAKGPRNRQQEEDRATNGKKKTRRSTARIAARNPQET
jgi:hypothetical protein